MTNENKMRRQFLRDFEVFGRRLLCLQDIFHGEDKDPHPLHVKGDWVQPVQRSVALESYLETVKTEIFETQLTKPKYNLPTIRAQHSEENK